MKVFSMTKFCIKKTSFANTAVFSLKMSELEICLWLTQGTNTSIQICRNIGATMRASRNIFSIFILFILSHVLTTVYTYQYI